MRLPDLPVLIIGGGFSGTLLALNLTRLGVPVVLFERDQANLAKGLAFGTRRPEHLLNVRAANMSAFPDDPDHFLRWLGHARGNPCNRFVPRLTYGQYVRECLSEALRTTMVPLEVCAGEVVDLIESSGGVHAMLNGGATLTGRAAVLALGNLAPRLPAPCAHLPSPLAQADPWARDALAGIDRDAGVVLLGTGLTAIDVIASLDQAGHRGAILALSRRGLRSRAHLAVGPELTGVDAPLARGSALLRAVRARARAAGWHVAIDELRPHTQDLWRAHSITAQRRFLRHLRPWWDVHRHRLAPDVAARIDALQRAGRVTCVAGRLVAAHSENGALTVSWRPRGSTSVVRTHAARVINCTGPEGDISHAHAPLVQTLLMRGTIRADAHRLGLDVDNHWRVHDRAGVPQPRIHAVGPLTRGIAWEMTAVPDIRRQVWSLARQLAQGGG